MTTRVAIVTPTIGEPEIELAIKSVDAQELPPDVELHHVIVMDGVGEVKYEQGGGNAYRHWLAMPGDKNGKGCGGQPRALGSQYAVDRLRVHALGFLDADNWIRANHVKTMLEVGASRPDCDAICARRFFIHWETGEPMPGLPDSSGAVVLGAGKGAQQPFVDTNCIWLQGRGVLLGRDWGIVRRWTNDEAGGFYDPDAPIKSGEDRVFWNHVTAQLRQGAYPVPMAAEPTVAYRSVWLVSYPLGGKFRPPPVAKNHDGDDVQRLRWRIVDAGKGPIYDVWPDGMDEPPVPDGVKVLERCEGTRRQQRLGGVMECGR